MNVEFSWRRNRLFDRASVVVMFERCLDAHSAKVVKVQERPTSKWRPLPLTTVELQKLGSMYLRLPSARVMNVRATTNFMILTDTSAGCREALSKGLHQLSAYGD